MATNSDVFETLRYLGKRHDKLRGRFGEFYKEGKEILTEQGAMPGISFGELKEPTHFDVSFAGFTTRFAFVFIDSEIESCGQVDCRLVDPWDREKVTSLGQFKFNGQGQADVKAGSGPYSGDVLFVNDGGGAATLIAKHLHKAIKSAAPPPK